MEEACRREREPAPIPLRSSGERHAQERVRKQERAMKTLVQVIIYFHNFLSTRCIRYHAFYLSLVLVSARDDSCFSWFVHVLRFTSLVDNVKIMLN